MSRKYTTSVILVKFPTHTPKDILNGNHKQLRGGKGNAAHQQTTNFIYMITRPETGFTDRPRNIQYLVYIILPIMKIMYFGISIVLFVLNVRMQTNVSNQTTAISMRSIVTISQ